jgi:plasmid stabilization system protein ParE
MKIAWLPRAAGNLEAIRRYVELDDPVAARKVARSIIAAVETLAETPAIGRPGRVAGTRELVLTKVPYLVAYRVVAGTVEVLRVLHARRRWPKHFDD